MSSVAVRQSGGASIVSIPKAILKQLGLKAGSTLEIAINEDNAIVMTPQTPVMTLESLIADSPKSRLSMTPEDSEWAGMPSAGKEL